MPCLTSIAFFSASISRPVELRPSTSGTSYLYILEHELDEALAEFTPDLLVYNAGTDSLSGDPLGLLDLSPQAIVKRDEIVFSRARQRNIPIVMFTSGGYTRFSARVIADSILNLNSKGLVTLC